MKLFHQANANLNIKNYDSRTIAHIAAAEGHEAFLTFLATDTEFDFTTQDRNNVAPIDEIQDITLAQKIRQLVH